MGRNEPLARGLLLGLLALPGTALAARVAPSASAEAGTGYDSNLSAGSTPEAVLGALTWEASGRVAASTGLGPLRLGLSGRYERVAVPSWPDLSMHGPSASLGIISRVGSRFLLSLTPGVGLAFYGDPQRDSLSLGARAGLRYRASDLLALRAGYRFSSVNAEAAVFDRTIHRFRVGPELSPGRRTWIELGYELELGQTVRYELIESTAASAKAGQGSGSGSGSGEGSGSGDGDQNLQQEVDTFDGTWLATRVPATSHAVVLEVEQGVNDWLGFYGWGGFAHVLAEPTPFDAWFTTIGVRVQTP